jgi:putative membrane protein
MPEAPDEGTPVASVDIGHAGSRWPPSPGDPMDPRFTLANERTFLAWIRTSMAMLVAGLAVTQFFKPFSVVEGRRIVGVPLIALGALVSFWCFRRWQIVERAMSEGRSVHATWLPAVVAIVIGVVGLAAVIFVLVGPA